MSLSVVQTNNSTAFSVAENCPVVARLWESKHRNSSLSSFLNIALLNAHPGGPMVTKQQRLAENALNIASFREYISEDVSVCLAPTTSE